MSDIAINVPLPLLLLLLGALYWPVTLAVSMMFVAAGVLVPWRWLRVVCLTVAALLACDCLLAIYFGSDRS